MKATKKPAVELEPINLTVTPEGELVTAALISIIRQKKAALDAKRAAQAAHQTKRDAA